MSETAKRMIGDRFYAMHWLDPNFKPMTEADLERAEAEMVRKGFQTIKEIDVGKEFLGDIKPYPIKGIPQAQWNAIKLNVDYKGPQ